MGNTDSKLNQGWQLHLNHLLSPNKPILRLFNDNIDPNVIIDTIFDNNLDNLDNLDVSIFNPFYIELLSIPTINKTILYNIISSNHQNFENLLRFVILNFILHVKMLSNNILTKDIECNLQKSIYLLINLLPIYYSSNNINNDFIWNDESWDIILNLNENFIIKNNNITSLPSISLGSLIIDNLLKLSFVQGFTIYNSDDIETLWENGIGTKDNFTLRQYPHLDSNRLICLNLWITLLSNELYSQKNIFLKIISQSNDPMLFKLLLSIINISSLFANNFKLNLSSISTYYKDNNQLNQLKKIDDSISTDNKNLINLKLKLVQTGIQFINIILSNSNTNSNSPIIKLFISTFLQREFDFKLLVSSFTKIFKYPIDKCIEIELNPLTFNKNLDSTNDYSNPSIPNDKNTSNNNNTHTNSQSDNDTTNLPDIPELLIQYLLLLKSLIQFNPKFKNYFIDKFANKFIIFNIYYIKYYSNIPKYKSTLIPLCYTLTMILLNEKLTLYKLLTTFSINYYTNKLPNFFKLSNLELNNINSLTYRDFIIIHLSNWNIKLIKQNLIPNNFNFEIIYNILPINNNIINIENNGNTPLSSSASSSTSNFDNNNESNDILSYNAALALLNLFAKMSIKSYLSSFGNNEIYLNGSQSLSLPSWKLDQLALMIRSILKFINFNYNQSKNLIFLLTRHQNLLFQIKDSLSFISKIIFNNPTKLNDYMFNKFETIQNLKKIEFMIQLNEHDLVTNNLNNEKCCTPITTNTTTPTNTNNNNSDLSSDSNESFTPNNQTLIFNKTIQYSSDDETSTNENMNTNTTNTTPSNNPNNDDNDKKKIKIWEHSDYINDLFINDKYIYTTFKTHWPLGLNENYKLKSLQNLSIDPTDNKYWTGYQDLKLLTRIIKLFILEFPEIPKTKKNSEFTILLKKFDVFKPKLNEKINSQLPIYLTNTKFYDGIKFSINDNGFKEWVYKLCWTDIFNSHSYPYQYESDIIGDSNPITDTNKSDIKTNETTPQNKRLSGVVSMENTNNYTNNRASLSSSPLLPSLERWSSNNSNLSRTQSNNSSILNFFNQDNNSNNNNNDNEKPTTNNNNTQQHQLSTSASSSSGFFKFSWSNFHKGDEENDTTIKEEIDDNDDEIQPDTSNTFNYPIDLYKVSPDEQLVRDNIWVNTKIKLFTVKKEEKEELSFLDMTSSLLKKFKFSNVVDTSYEDNGPYISTNSESLMRPIRRYY